MADPFSVALGVVGVAEVGFKLVETIYTYTNSVRKAEQQLRPVAEYVQVSDLRQRALLTIVDFQSSNPRVTSTAFEHIASHLRDEDLTELFKPALLRAIKDALTVCEEAFRRLKVYVEAITTDGSDQSRGFVTARTKLTWWWKQKELENHQLRLEHCKSTVNVLLSALTFVNSSRCCSYLPTFSKRSRLTTV